MNHKQSIYTALSIIGAIILLLTACMSDSGSIGFGQALVGAVVGTGMCVGFGNEGRELYG